MQKIIFIIEKIQKYRKCPALAKSFTLLSQCLADSATWSVLISRSRSGFSLCFRRPKKAKMNLNMNNMQVHYHYVASDKLFILLFKANKGSTYLSIYKYK